MYLDATFILLVPIFSTAMATKGPVLSIAERPAFVRSSPVRCIGLCKQQKLWPPGWLPCPHQSTNRDWGVFWAAGRYRPADQEQGSQVRSCLINLINFFEQQPCKRTRLRQETVIHPDFKAQEDSENQQRLLWRCCWGLDSLVRLRHGNSRKTQRGGDLCSWWLSEEVPQTRGRTRSA